jgi:hypothetical protein
MMTEPWFTPPTINTDQVSEGRPHQFYAEASTVGLPPGRWPYRLPTTMGNKHDFVMVANDTDKEGDNTFVQYRQECGCLTLTLFND